MLKTFNLTFKCAGAKCSLSLFVRPTIFPASSSLTDVLKLSPSCQIINVLVSYLVCLFVYMFQRKVVVRLWEKNLMTKVKPRKLEPKKPRNVKWKKRNEHSDRWVNLKEQTGIHTEISVIKITSNMHENESWCNKFQVLQYSGNSLTRTLLTRTSW